MKINYNTKTHSIELKAETEAENHQLGFIEEFVIDHNIFYESKSEQGHRILKLLLK